MSSISEDDDSGPSLKELVTKNLEANGVLGKLQAQLRASVFLILEEEFQEKNIPILNENTQQQLNTHMGKIALSIIQDFLQCLNLEFTLAVFAPETKTVLNDSTLNRQYLTKELGKNFKDNLPILFQLIEESRIDQKKDAVSKDPIISNADIQPKSSSKNTLSETSISEKENEYSKSVDSFKSETTESRIPSVVDLKDKLTKTSTEEEKIKSENESSKVKSTEESSGSKIITKNDSVESTTNGATKSSSSSNSSSSTNNSEKETSNPSTITNNHKSDKNTLSGIEKEYEEEFSSLSEFKNQTLEDSSTNESDETEEKEDDDKKDKKKSEEKEDDDKKDRKKSEENKINEEESEIEEAVETAEDIEEDISSLDDLLSSNSEISNQTKDITLSKDNNVVDYEESL